MLLDDIDNVNFERLDEIAKNLNYDINDERRIEASIIYIMKKLIFEKGDTYLIKEDIINNTLKYLKLDIDIEINLINLNKSGKIIIEQDKYYLTEIYHSEKNVANTLYYLANKDYSKKNDIVEV